MVLCGGLTGRAKNNGIITTNLYNTHTPPLVCNMGSNIHMRSDKGEYLILGVGSVLTFIRGDGMITRTNGRLVYLHKHT